MPEDLSEPTTQTETAPPPSSEVKGLSPTNVERIIELLKAKLTTHNCPRCQTDDWGVDRANFVVTMARSFQVPPPYVPLIMVICKNCGNVNFHSPIALGIDPRLLEAER
jgi:hypothetical protein